MEEVGNSMSANDVIERGSSPPLDLDPNEVIGADEETLPYTEENWQDPEQMEVFENLEQDLPLRYRLDKRQDKTHEEIKSLRRRHRSGQNRSEEDS